MNILTIDWDWVTGDCSDGNPAHHNHCGWCETYDNRDPQMRRGLKRLMDRSRYEKHGEILIALLKRVLPNVTHAYVSECHADVLNLIVSLPGDTIWSIDAHDDSYPDSYLHCDSWEHFARRLNMTVHSIASDRQSVSYERAWPDGVQEIRRQVPNSTSVEAFTEHVDTIHLAHSSPWTPAATDKDFCALCESIAKRVPIEALCGGSRNTAHLPHRVHRIVAAYVHPPYLPTPPPASPASLQDGD